jgi:predicted nucleic acid-binding protein
MTPITDPQSQPVFTLLDTCAVLSLYATRRMAEIIAVVSSPVAVADAVLQEAMYVRRIVEGVPEREPVNLTPLVASGVLAVIGAETEDELQTFVDLAVELDDGEAMTAALALHRRYMLVTDDRKAERLLAGRVKLRATLDVIQAWAEEEQVDDGTLQVVLTGVYERGYQPPNRHALKPWWDRVMSGGPPSS